MGRLSVAKNIITWYHADYNTKNIATHIRLQTAAFWLNIELSQCFFQTLTALCKLTTNSADFVLEWTQ
jgi:hypothetical protein